MATGTIPAPTLAAIEQVLHTYGTSTTQTQQDIQQMLRDGMGLTLGPSVESSYRLTIEQGASTHASYDQDFYAWTQEQAALLRKGAVHELDLTHLAEEIEDMGHSQQDKLASHLLVLLTHLLKLMLAARYLPTDYERAARGWRLTCQAQRLQIAKVVRRNPRLRSTVSEELADAYGIARLEAARDLPLDETLVPEPYPWLDNDVLEPDFWPDAPQESHPTDTP